MNKKEQIHALKEQLGLTCLGNKKALSLCPELLADCCFGQNQPGVYAATHSIKKEKIKSLTFSLPEGELIELKGPARLSWLLRFLSAQSKAEFLFLQNKITAAHINPVAVAQAGLDLKRVQWLDAETKDFLKLLRIALKTQAFRFIVCPPVFSELTEYRRLHLLAGAAKAYVFLLNDGEQFHSAWPIALQLHIDFTNDKKFSLHIYKQKYF